MPGRVRVFLVVLEPLDEGDGTLGGQLVAWSVQGELGHGVALETHAGQGGMVAVQN